VTNPVETLAAAVYGYLAKAPDKVHSFDTDTRNWVQPRSTEDLEVIHFQQSWSNTALMFDGQGGIAGQAFTSAYTTVICDDLGMHVFCNGRPAYDLGNGISHEDRAKFARDVADRRLVSQKNAVKRYGATLL
jgi:hypothetical protein